MAIQFSEEMMAEYNREVKRLCEEVQKTRDPNVIHQYGPMAFVERNLNVEIKNKEITGVTVNRWPRLKGPVPTLHRTIPTNKRGVFEIHKIDQLFKLMDMCEELTLTVRFVADALFHFDDSYVTISLTDWNKT